MAAGHIPISHAVAIPAGDIPVPQAAPLQRSAPASAGALNCQPISPTSSPPLHLRQLSETHLPQVQLRKLPETLSDATLHDTSQATLQITHKTPLKFTTKATPKLTPKVAPKVTPKVITKVTSRYSSSKPDAAASASTSLARSMPEIRVIASPTSNLTNAVKRSALDPLEASSIRPNAAKHLRKSNLLSTQLGYRSTRPSIVLARTRPISNVLSPKATLSVPQCVPHRRDNQSTVTFLNQHFSSQILRDLRPGLEDPATRIMPASIIDGAEESFTVALRFYIFRLHTVLQMGGGRDWSVAAAGLDSLSPDIATWPVVTVCKQLSGDVWSIETDRHVYICLGSTGEVIQQSRIGDPEPILRADWAAYILSPFPVLAAVKSKDSHDFPRGIFRGFHGGDEARQVAERVVLSSCVLQSSSGQHMSLMAMESEWLGQAPEKATSNENVRFFLPESHQVVSLHLTQNSSVGVVHRNGGFAQYVLRETGQIIGDEDGISPLWQGLLSCDDRGHHKEHPSFWAGWEERWTGMRD